MAYDELKFPKWFSQTHIAYSLLYLKHVNYALPESTEMDYYSEDDVVFLW